MGEDGEQVVATGNAVNMPVAAETLEESTKPMTQEESAEFAKQKRKAKAFGNQAINLQKVLIVLFLHHLIWYFHVGNGELY